MGDILCGFASAPVKVNDNGDEYETAMVAGLVGIRATSSGAPLAAPNREDNLEGSDIHPQDSQSSQQTVSLDSIQPVSGWWMYEKEDVKAEEEQQRVKEEVDDALGSCLLKDTALPYTDRPSIF
ncbi:hypothetical protein ETB97_003776 [Aspergillus alliaceus]|uniref:Uncharacterized protein n=1 Tax=Petromyces alliaceus TaxID=209559 RepID=A0A8H6A0M4_PETAA|nr:hypothetical protein ETB97_003776 [Aspergillus burnettii]